MSIYKSIFVSDEFEGLEAGTQVQGIDGSVRVFGETAFSSLEQAVAAVNSKAVIARVSSGKYDYFVADGAGNFNAAEQVVYVNFNGGSGLSYDNGEYSRSVDMAPAAYSASEQADVISALNDLKADSGVVFTSEVPAGSVYSTIYVGSTSSFDDLGSFKGLSETVDTSNSVSNDEAFVNTNNIANIEELVEVIGHEAGHLVGEAHDIASGTIGDFADPAGTATYSGIAYSTLNEAISAAKGDQDAVVTLDGSLAGNAIVTDGQNITFTGEATLNWKSGWFFVGRGGEQTDRDAVTYVTFKDATIGTTEFGTYALGFNVSKYDSRSGKETTNTGVLTFEDSVIATDYIYNVNVVNVINTTLTAGNMSISGKTAAESRSGEDEAAYLNVSQGSYVTVLTENGHNVGDEGGGVLNITGGSTFLMADANNNYGNRTWSVTGKGQVNLSESSSLIVADKLGGGLVNNGAITIDCTSTITAEAINNAGTISIDVAGISSTAVKLIDTNNNFTSTGTIQFVKNGEVVTSDDYSYSITDGDLYAQAKLYVAEVNGVKYETLSAAYSAAQSGDTVKLLVDAIANINGIPAGVTLEGVEGKTTVTTTLGQTLNDVTIKNIKFAGAGNALRWCYVNAGHTTTIENCEFAQSGAYGIHFDGTENGVVIVKDSYLKSWNSGNPGFFLDNCVIDAGATYSEVRPYEFSSFTNCRFTEAFVELCKEDGDMGVEQAGNFALEMTNCSVVKSKDDLSESTKYTISDVLNPKDNGALGENSLIAIDPVKDGEGKYTNGMFFANKASVVDSYLAEASLAAIVGNSRGLVYNLPEEGTASVKICQSIAGTVNVPDGIEFTVADGITYGAEATLTGNVNYDIKDAAGSMTISDVAMSGSKISNITVDATTALRNANSITGSTLLVAGTLTNTGALAIDTTAVITAGSFSGADGSITVDMTDCTSDVYLLIDTADNAGVFGTVNISGSEDYETAILSGDLYMKKKDAPVVEEATVTHTGLGQDDIQITAQDDTTSVAGNAATVNGTVNVQNVADSNLLVGSISADKDVTIDAAAGANNTTIGSIETNQDVNATNGGDGTMQLGEITAGGSVTIENTGDGSLSVTGDTTVAELLEIRNETDNDLSHSGKLAAKDINIYNNDQTKDTTVGEINITQQIEAQGDISITNSSEISDETTAGVINLGTQEHTAKGGLTIINTENNVINGGGSEAAGDEQAANITVKEDVVITNDGHLNANITTDGDLVITNSSVNTLIGDYTAANITLANDGGAHDVTFTATAGNVVIDNTVGADPASGVIDNVTINALNGYAAISGNGTTTNAVINTDTLFMGGTTLEITGGTILDSYSTIYLSVDEFLDPVPGADLTITGDLTVGSRIYASAFDPITFDPVLYGTVTMNGTQTYTGDIEADTIVVATGADVTIDNVTEGSDQFDFNTLTITGTLTTDFDAQNSYSGAGAVTGAGSLKISTAGEWIVNDSVYRDFSGFTGSVSMTQAGAEITMGIGDAPAATPLVATDSYFADGVVMTIAAGQAVNLKGAGVTTGIDFAGAGTLNVYEDQTLSGDLSGFSGTIVADTTNAATATITGTVADTLNLAGNAVVLDDAVAHATPIAVNANTTLASLAANDNDIALVSGTFSAVTSTSGNIDLTGYTAGTLDTLTSTTGDILIASTQNITVSTALDGNLAYTVTAAQTDDTADVAFTGGSLTYADVMTVTAADNYFETPYKLLSADTLTIDETTFTFTLTVGANSGVIELGDMTMIGGTLYRLSLEGTAGAGQDLVVAAFNANTNTVYVNNTDAAWLAAVPYEAVMDTFYTDHANDVQRNIGYDAANSIDNAIVYIKADATGPNAGKGTIELTESVTYSISTALGTTGLGGNGVTNMTLRSRSVAEYAASGNSKVTGDINAGAATTLTLQNISATGSVYGAGALNIAGTKANRFSGTNIVAGGVLDITGGTYTARYIAGGTYNTDNAGTGVVTIHGAADRTSISGTIYGGSIASGSGIAVTQNNGAFVVIDADDLIYLTGNIYAAGLARSGATLTVNGNREVIFTGAGSNLNFTGRVSGAAQGGTIAGGTATLTFDDFTGKFNGSISDFGSITISGTTALELGRRQTQTGATAVNFELTGASVAGTSMYTVRDLNAWEFAKTISVSADTTITTGTKSGTYVLVDNYAAGFGGFNFTVAGVAADLGDVVTVAGNTYTLNYQSDKLTLTFVNNWDSAVITDPADQSANSKEFVIYATDVNGATLTGDTSNVEAISAKAGTTVVFNNSDYADANLLDQNAAGALLYKATDPLTTQTSIEWVGNSDTANVTGGLTADSMDISGKTLTVDNANIDDLSVTEDATLNLTSGASTIDTITMAAGTNLTFDVGSGATVSSGTGAITITGSNGTVTINNEGTLTAQVTSAGTVVISNTSTTSLYGDFGGVGTELITLDNTGKVADASFTADTVELNDAVNATTGGLGFYQNVTVDAAELILNADLSGWNLAADVTFPGTIYSFADAEVSELNFTIDGATSFGGATAVGAVTGADLTSTVFTVNGAELAFGDIVSVDGVDYTFDLYNGGAYFFQGGVPTADMSTIVIDAALADVPAFTPVVYNEVEYLVGLNAFAGAANAFDAATEDTVTYKFESDSAATLTSSTDLYFYADGAFEGNGHALDMTSAGKYFAFNGVNGENPTVTISDLDITMNDTTGNKPVYFGYDTADAVTVQLVNSDLVASRIFTGVNAELIVDKDSHVTTTSNQDFERLYGNVTVTGDASFSVATATADDIQLKTKVGFAALNGAALTFTNTYVTNRWQFRNNATGSVTLDNALLVVGLDIDGSWYGNAYANGAMANADYNKGDLILTNGSRQYMVSCLANNDAAATITLSGASELETGLFVTNDGTISLSEGSLLNVGTDTAKVHNISSLPGYAYDLVNNGTINVAGSTVSAGNAVTNAGAITLDTDSLITAQSLTNSGTITIDAAAFAGGYKKVIDLNQGSALSDIALIHAAEGVSLSYAADGDVYVVDPASLAGTLYVNSAWSELEPGAEVTIIPGVTATYGTDAFSTVQDTAAAVGADTERVIFVDGGDYASGAVKFAGSLDFSADELVTFASGEFGLGTKHNEWGEYDKETYTLSGDYNFFQFATQKYANVDLTIDGNVYLQQSAWIKAGAHAVLTEGSTIQRVQSGWDGQFCVYGTLDVEGTLDYFTELSMNHAFRVGNTDYTVPGELNVTGSVSVRNPYPSNNNIYSGGIVGVAANGTVNVADGGSFSAEGTITNDGAINIADGELTAESLINNGTVTATSGNVTMNISDSATGNKINVLDGVTLSGSMGMLNVTGGVTLDDVTVAATKSGGETSNFDSDSTGTRDTIVVKDFTFNNTSGSESGIYVGGYSSGVDVEVTGAMNLTGSSSVFFNSYNASNVTVTETGSIATNGQMRIYGGSTMTVTGTGAENMNEAQLSGTGYICVDGGSLSLTDTVVSLNNYIVIRNYGANSVSITNSDVTLTQIYTNNKSTSTAGGTITVDNSTLTLTGSNGNPQNLSNYTFNLINGSTMTAASGRFDTQAGTLNIDNSSLYLGGTAGSKGASLQNSGSITVSNQGTLTTGNCVVNNAGAAITLAETAAMSMTNAINPSQNKLWNSGNLSLDVDAVLNGALDTASGAAVGVTGVSVLTTDVAGTKILTGALTDGGTAFNVEDVEASLNGSAVQIKGAETAETTDDVWAQLSTSDGSLVVSWGRTEGEVAAALTAFETKKAELGLEIGQALTSTSAEISTVDDFNNKKNNGTLA